MSLFARTKVSPAPAMEERSGSFNPFAFNQWVAAISGAADVTPTSAGTIPTAMRASVVYRCVTLVSGTVATFPIHAKRGRLTLDPGPSIIRRPSPAVRRSVWVEQAVASMLLRGGAYGLTDDPSSWRGGYPTRVDLIHPDRVTWTEADGWMLDGKTIEEYPLGPLWQVPLHVMAGSPKGLNPLEYARRTVYAKLVAQEFGANFFRDGGHPTAILSPEEDPGREGAKALKSAFMEATRGNREPVVVPQSVKYTQLQINPDDSQFIEAMRFSDEELARFFGVTSAMADIVVSGTSLTYSNITDRREDFKQFTLLLPMYRLEEAMTELIPRPQEVKFNPAGLLKGSITERYATYKTAAEINNLTGETFMTTEQMREYEDWDPLPDDESESTPAASVVDDESDDDGERAYQHMRAMSEAIRTLAERSAAPVPSVQLHVPESLVARMDIPTPQVTVNVEPTPVEVNVEAPSVTVNVEPTPVAVAVDAPVVNVAAPSVSVPAPVVTVVDNDSGTKSVKFRRNDKGQIVSAEVTD